MDTISAQHIVKSLQHHKAQASLIGIPPLFIRNRQERKTAVLLRLPVHLMQFIIVLLDQQNLMSVDSFPAAGNFSIGRS